MRFAWTLRSVLKEIFLGRSRLEVKSRLYMALVLLLVIGGSFYLTARRTHRQIREQMYERALLVANTFFAEREADANRMRTLKGDREDFGHPQYQEAHEDRNFRWRQIYQGAPFATSQPRDGHEKTLLESFSDGAELKTVERTTKAPVTFQRYYQLLVPMTARESCLECHSDYQKGSFQGILSVELPLAQVERDLRNNKLLMLASAVVALVVALGTLCLLIRFLIIGPLSRLKETTDAVAAGDLEARVQVRTGDELQEFADALNHMIETVQHSHRALAELNRNLDSQLDALGRANLELHELHQMRSQFLANMSHELLSPLHSVLGFCQVLLEETYGPLTERQHRYVEDMLSSGYELLDLISNLLEMGRIEAGRMEKNLDRVSVAELVHSVVAKLEPMRSDGLTVKVEVPRSLPPVFLDPRKTRRILSNLLSNAYKFTPGEGRVTVSTQARDGQLILSVTDTGIGIRREDLPRIFDKFRQVDGGSARRFEGSGLGLAIVQELVRFLGGQVEVESTPGVGSTFIVSLPVADAP